jgi:hypothetical protein
MSTPDEDWSAVFTSLEQLRDRWPDNNWSYDRRLKCVASSIPLTREADARAAIADVLTQSWSATTLETAPEPVKALAQSCGGLRASQLLFWGGAADGAGPFGLWWPWGDGTNVSLRIGLHGVDSGKVRYPRLRDIFGIPNAPAA